MPEPATARPRGPAATPASRTTTPVWLTRAEAADRAHVSLSTLDRAIARGDLKAGRPPGRIVRIRPEWVDEWMAARR